MDNTNIEALYKDEKLLNMVRRRCREILHNEEDAMDAVHDVFEKLLEKEKNIFFPKSYLYEMATNFGINKIRKRRNEIYRLFAITTNVSINRVRKTEGGAVSELFRTDINNVEEKNDTFIDKSYEQLEMKMLIEALLKEEDEMTRVIYFMRYYDNMKYKEIGEAVGKSKSAVEKKLKKFEEHVRMKLKKDNK